MKILVMGAGAVGAYFGARLQQAGAEVVYCARGENLRALQERGLDITSIRGDFKLAAVVATDDPREFAPYDLILFCVKVYDTDAAAGKIKGCLAPDGRYPDVAKRGRERSPAGRAFRRRCGDGRQRPARRRTGRAGKILHSTTGTIEFGELDGRVDRARRRDCRRDAPGRHPGGELSRQYPRIALGQADVERGIQHRYYPHSTGPWARCSTTRRDPP